MRVDRPEAELARQREDHGVVDRMRARYIGQCESAAALEIDPYGQLALAVIKVHIGNEPWQCDAQRCFKDLSAHNPGYRSGGGASYPLRIQQKPKKVSINGRSVDLDSYAGPQRGDLAEKTYSFYP